MKQRVLIVEDEPIIAAVLKMDLLALGYEVLPVAFSADKALALTEKHKPDIILTCILLEGNKTGFDLAQEIEKTRKTPIIFITADVHLADNNEWVKKSTHKVIPKPVLKHQLDRLIEEALGRRPQK